MNTIFSYATQHLTDRHCDHNNHDRFHHSSQSIKHHSKKRIQINVSKNYTGKQFRIIEPKETV